MFQHTYGMCKVKISYPDTYKIETNKFNKNVTMVGNLKRKYEKIEKSDSKENHDTCEMSKSTTTSSKEQIQRLKSMTKEERKKIRCIS